MTGEPRPLVEGDDVLRFAPHAKFRFDEVRQAWIVLAPERLLIPDEQAVEILQLIDGECTIDSIIDELVRRYDAPRDVIARDVAEALGAASVDTPEDPELLSIQTRIPGQDELFRQLFPVEHVLRCFTSSPPSKPSHSPSIQ